MSQNALVAQLDRVLGYEPSGRRFESSRVRHLENKKPCFYRAFYFLDLKKWVVFDQSINRLVFTSLLDNLAAADNKKA